MTSGDWPGAFEKIVRTHVPYLAPDAVLEPQARLMDLGLDSLATVSLLVDVEECFSVAFPEDELGAETFQTPARLWAAVARLSKNTNGQGGKAGT